MIISDRQIFNLYDHGEIVLEPLESLKDYLNPASVDLPITGGEYYVTNIVPPKINQKFLDKYASKRGYTEDGLIIEPSEKLFYILPGPEIKLPENLEGRLNPKSTSGRLGLQCNSLVEGEESKVNKIPCSYKGKIFFLVQSKQFPTELEAGDTLTQIRFREKNTGFLSSECIRSLYGIQIKVKYKGELIPHKEITKDNSTILRINTSKILKAKCNNPEPIVFSKKNKAEISDYYEIIINKENKDLIIEPGNLYLISSLEETYCGNQMAWEMRIRTEEVGTTFQTHSAGFGDPGFNARVTGEVWSYTNPLIFSHGDYFTKLDWEHVEKPPAKIYGEKRSHYQKQDAPIPPKQFKDYNKLWEKVKNGEIETNSL
jgi:deoxycytidine triphosphate deaminase